MLKISNTFLFVFFKIIVGYQLANNKMGEKG